MSKPEITLYKNYIIAQITGYQMLPPTKIMRIILDHNTNPQNFRAAAVMIESVYHLHSEVLPEIRRYNK
jgi:hypothetical protein